LFAIGEHCLAASGRIIGSGSYLRKGNSCLLYAGTENIRPRGSSEPSLCWSLPSRGRRVVSPWGCDDLNANHLAEVSLGYLGVLSFELQSLFSGAGAFRIGEQGAYVMVDNNPPKDERKKTAVVIWARRVIRKLVNRQTLMIALQVLYWIVKFARLFMSEK
jgi:hypothetical protein